MKKKYDMDTISFFARVELARRHFWDYCNLMAPDFYTHDREYLKTLCNELENFYYSDDRVLMINIPPRHGKSRTASLFVEWLLGKDRSVKVMTGSYNETLSTSFSKAVRNAIMEAKGDRLRPVYSDVFPESRIKRGDGAMNLWSLEGGFNNYLATSPTGTATGFGADILCIDDLIKTYAEACNELTLESHWTWFTNTMLSRLENGGKIILIMTRWATTDLCGRYMEHLMREEESFRHVTMKALQDDGSMLCEGVLSRKQYNQNIKLQGLDLVKANYDQEPIDLVGRLYNQGFKTYSGKLPQFDIIRSYTDTADTGADFLCSLVYGVTRDKLCYILDALYTKDDMSITEPKTAAMFIRNRVNVADIESNNGGRGFARSVERHLKEDRENRTVVQPFTQTGNKQSRILSTATWCMENIIFPETWPSKWPELYEAITKYQKEGKNEHDDAPDVLAGICEKCTKGVITWG